MRRIAMLGWMLAGVLSLQAAEMADPVRAFQEKRFGMFIHWGPVALKGTEIGWSRGREVPAGEYDQLYTSFNPEQFHAGDWVKLAIDAGMKYLVITSKHHDGFSIFHSDYTEYDIASTPFRRDVLQELSVACADQGLEFSTYHSICDWYHPDYPLGSPGGKVKKDTHNMPRYVEFLKNQTAEIIRKYGPLGVMWFDGEWEQPWTRAYGNDLYAYLKEIQPDLVINNRVSKGRHGMAGTTRQSDLNAGDYDTPEQRVGAFNRERPWETCMTICRQWAWKPDDRMKSLQECIQTLLKTVGGDGNLLFNVGPMPDGRIEPRQAERLREMGAWIACYQDGIYGTRGGPFKPGPWGAATCKGNKIYLYVMNWPDTEGLVLPELSMPVASTRILSGGSVTRQAVEDGFLLQVPPGDRKEIATVIELTVEGDATRIDPIEVHPEGKPLAILKARASNVYQEQAAYAPALACDGNLDTRWATDSGTGEAWIELDLGKAQTFNRIAIHEAYANRVQTFELQQLVDGQWQAFHTGTTLGEQARISFDPVTARNVRLQIKQSSDGPTIKEIQFFKGTRR